MKKWLKRAGMLLTLVAVLFAGWVGKGFYYAEEGGVFHTVNDRYFGRVGWKNQAFDFETRFGLWWHAPIVQAVEMERHPSIWQWPGWFQLMEGYEYWTLQEVEALASRQGYETNVDLESLVDEILSVYATHYEDYWLNEWGEPWKPEIIEFRLYDRQYGWRLGGQFNFKKNELTISTFYRESMKWGGTPMEDTVAHELWHAQGMHAVKLADANDMTWGDLYIFYQHTNESFTQLGSADVIAHAVVEIGPKYEAAFCNFMRSLYSGMMVYYAWYDGDAWGKMPLSASSEEVKREQLLGWGKAREDGKKMGPLWCRPFDLINNRFRDLSGWLNYEINKILWEMRQKAMQAQYWEIRIWAYNQIPGREILGARNARFKQWLAIPEEHAASLLEYDVLPFLLMQNSKSEVVGTIMTVPSIFGMTYIQQNVILSALYQRFWEGEANFGYANIADAETYICWLLKYNGINTSLILGQLWVGLATVAATVFAVKCVKKTLLGRGNEDVGDADEYSDCGSDDILPSWYYISNPADF
jgi:hypothetical protein